MENLNGKKLLILGATPHQMKFVYAAKSLGIYTIATDYLKNSPAKKICDKAYNIDVKDIESLVKMCKYECIDGVICGYIDPCQRPYQKLCNMLSLPCYGTEDQFYKMTNKQAFKEMCKENDINIIREFTKEDIKNRTLEFPVFIKPIDSRGSRGQSICYSYDSLEGAIKKAENESQSKSIIIEKFMGSAHEIQITYFYKDGKPYLIRTADSFTGSEMNHLENLVSCAISPSKYTKSYLQSTHPKVLKMFNKLGIQNGPVFMQGFEEGGEFCFFDPGLRFPGVDYELIYKAVFGIDLAQLLVIYAITGKMPDMELPEDSVYLQGKKAAILFPTIKAGVVNNISCLDKIKKREDVISCLSRVYVDQNVEWSYDVNQRLAEIDIIGENLDDLCKKINEIQESLYVTDNKNQNMIFEKFDTNKVLEKINENLSVKIITQNDLIKSGCFNVKEIINICENAFIEFSKGNIIFPEKISVIFNQETQNRINCMPAGLVNERVYGLKWVSVYPENPHLRYLPNSTAVIVLSELESGFPVAFMEGSLCSNLRTGAVGALGARYFAKKDSRVIGFIGAGEQAKAHFLTMKEVRPEIKYCKVASRTKKSEYTFITQMRKYHPDVEFEACAGNFQKAAEGSDIIVTAISGQKKILQADWVKAGAFYCHVGGLEDDFEVPAKAHKIICDNWNMVKHRTQTISQMYKKGLIKDCDIYADLHEVITGQKMARENDDEFIYFNSVGMSFVDIAVAHWMYKKVIENGLGIDIAMKNKSIYDI